MRAEALVYTLKAIICLKQKGNGFKVKAFDAGGADVPDQWKVLGSWYDAGWVMSYPARSLVNLGETDRVMIILDKQVLEAGDTDPGAPIAPSAP
jgi:hypothetical protein